jgi:hypothetical protein
MVSIPGRLTEVKVNEDGGVFLKVGALFLKSQVDFKNTFVVPVVLCSS